MKPEVLLLAAGATVAILIWLALQFLCRHDRRISTELAKLLRMPHKEKRAFVGRCIAAGCREVQIYFLASSGEMKQFGLESFLHLIQVKDPEYLPSFFVAQIVFERQTRGPTVYNGHSIYYLGRVDLSTKWHLEWDTLDLCMLSDRFVLLADRMGEIKIRPDSYNTVKEVLNFCREYPSVAEYRMRYFAAWAAKKLESTKAAFKSQNVELVRVGLEGLTSFCLDGPAGYQPDLDGVFSVKTEPT